MRHPPTIGPIEAPRYAPMVAADLGPTTRKLYGGLIEEGDPTGGIGRVNRRRQRVEQVAKIPPPVAQLAFRLYLPLHTPPDSLLSGAAVRCCRPPGGCRARCDVRVSVNSSAHLGADRQASIADPASGAQRYLNGGWWSWFRVFRRATKWQRETRRTSHRKELSTPSQTHDVVAS